MRKFMWTIPVFLVVGLASVASGATLTVSVGSNNPAATSVNPGTANHAMFELNLAASGGYTIRVTSLRVNAQGTLNDVTELTGVRLYVDNGNGNFDVSDTLISSGGYTADDGFVSFTGFTRYISNGSSENWWVVYDLHSGATPGDTFRVGFLSNTDITAQYRPG